MTTAELLSLLAGSGSSPEHWAELVQRHGTRLWAVCRAAAGAHLADDAFQNGLITIRRRASRFRPGRDPEASAVAWMVTVVHHCAIDLVRHERRRSTREGQRMPNEASASASASASAFPEPPSDPERDAAIARQAMQALEQLPERHREVIRLRLLGGLDAGQTAAVLGCPTEHVRVRLHRALQLLRSRCSIPSGALSVALLERTISTASAPPAALPTSAHLIATSAYTLPAVTGISLGAIMAVSSIGVGILASAALILSPALRPGAMAAADQPGPVTTAAASASPAPAATNGPATTVSGLSAEADVRLAIAEQIMALPEVRRVGAMGVQNAARSQGVQASDEALSRAALAAVNADTELWAGFARSISDHGTRESLAAQRDFFTAPAGRAYLTVLLHLQEAVSGAEMHTNFIALEEAAVRVVERPEATLPDAPAFDPGLGQARCLARATGYDQSIEDALLKELAQRLHGHSAIEISAALDRALDANPHWQDPVLRVYVKYMRKSDMEDCFAYNSSPLGRLQTAEAPMVGQEANTVMVQHLKSLVAAIRQQLGSPEEHQGTASHPPAPANPGF